MMVKMEAIDELRELAKAFPETSTRRTLLMRAADTILELRDDLQRANAAVQDAEHDESMAWDRVRKVERESAKLRELVADAIPLIWLGNVDCSGCLHMRECYAGEATDFAPENCRLVVRAHELGIEVDG